VDAPVYGGEIDASHTVGNVITGSNQLDCFAV
jgi:hypothetical protein